MIVPNKKIRLRIYTKTNSKTEKIEVEPNYLIVSIHSAPEKGKANKEIIDLLSDLLKINSSAFTIVSGLKNRDKTIEINCSEENNLDPNELKRRLTSK